MSDKTERQLLKAISEFEGWSQVIEEIATALKSHDEMIKITANTLSMINARLSKLEEKLND